MLDTKSGKEYDTSGYDVLRNISMPILTNTNEVLVVNSTHISLIDPVEETLAIEELPVRYIHGVHRSVLITYIQVLSVANLQYCNKMH